LKPQLGVVSVDEYEFVLADIPGLIEGAADGVGLGLRFLGHIERCGVILHLVDGTADDVVASYQTVRAEVERYSDELSEKYELVALTKADALSEEELKEKHAALAECCGSPVWVISAATHRGMESLLRRMWQVISAVREGRSPDDKDEY
jgi:GTP-binding protein